MSIRPFRDIKRRKTKVINVGDVKIGGDNPISVQSMTNTLTTDVKKTINQINNIAEEGGDIVRVSCPDARSTKALKEIVKHVSVPLVADIHFHYKRAIEAAENGAKCLRINPGNIGEESKIHDVLTAAKNNDCSIRIGVNAGSLEKDILEKFKEPCPEALVESALRNIKILEDKDFFNFKISVKSSDVFLSIGAYRQLSKVCDYPLHLGIMCCAIEMGQASAPDHDIDRLGVVYRSSPRQCDVLIVNGPVCEKLRPKLKTLYEQMPEPKWVIAMGECAISGGPYWDSYSVVAGADTFMPVDVYIPGCPVRPEALMHGFLTLQKKIREKEPGMFLRR